MLNARPIITTDAGPFIDVVSSYMQRIIGNLEKIPELKLSADVSRVSIDTECSSEGKYYVADVSAGVEISHLSWSRCSGYVQVRCAALAEGDTLRTDVTRMHDDELIALDYRAHVVAKMMEIFTEFEKDLEAIETEKSAIIVSGMPLECGEERFEGLDGEGSYIDTTSLYREMWFPGIRVSAKDSESAVVIAPSLTNTKADFLVSSDVGRMLGSPVSWISDDLALEQAVLSMGFELDQVDTCVPFSSLENISVDEDIIPDYATTIRTTQNWSKDGAALAAMILYYILKHDCDFYDGKNPMGFIKDLRNEICGRG